MSTVVISDSEDKDVVTLSSITELEEFLSSIFKASARSFDVTVDCVISYEENGIKKKIKITHE